MARQWPLLTLSSVVVALGFAGLIVVELRNISRAPASRRVPAASVATTPAAAPVPLAPGNAAHDSVVASRNLFSPARTDTPPAPPPTPAAAVPVVPKPNLLGVVLIEGIPVAYLEDPASKRVARYRVGDSVAGGTVKAIESDTVMLLRHEGQVTVRLHDASRPRTAAAHPPGAPRISLAPHFGGMPPQAGPPSAVRRPLIPTMPGHVPPQPTDAHSPQ
jgi:hypothetical protein